MGWFHRLIGKAAASTIGKRIIGKVSDAGIKLISHAKSAYNWAKKKAPILSDAADSAVEKLALSHDTKESLRNAQDLLHLGSAYGDNKIQFPVAAAMAGGIYNRKRGRAAVSGPGADLPD